MEKKFVEALQEAEQGLAAAKNKLGDDHPEAKALQKLVENLQRVPK